jgi:cytochrome oxidase Cu insertion factor (SCO1/SenC/PrrC family)
MHRGAEKHTSVQIQPVFISIDPARDTVSQVKRYVSGAPPLSNSIHLINAAVDALERRPKGAEDAGGMFAEAQSFTQG